MNAHWFTPNQADVPLGTFVLGMAITATLILALLKALGLLLVSWWLVVAPAVVTTVFLVFAAAYFLWSDAAKLDSPWQHPGAQ